MRRNLLIGILISLLLPMAGAYARERHAQDARFSAAAPSADRKVILGVYDPHAVFAKDTTVQLEHFFIYWQATKQHELRERLRYAGERARMLMVTVEPYTRATDWRSGGEHLFADILSGDFAREIETICRTIGESSNHTLIRWGHEMEDPSERYPWARQDHGGFKLAFRHFVQECRRYAPSAWFVWSPKGEKNLASYYPGDDVVDAVGVSVYGLQKMDAAIYGGDRIFPQAFQEKYGRVAGFGKPVIIAELGVAGSSQYRQRWFSSLLETVRTPSRFQQLWAVVYFNDKEPYHWPMGYGSPDWRVSPEAFQPGAYSQVQTANR